jgi:hypothetical protein
LPLSVIASTHAPLQSRWPVGHAHRPAAQICSVGHRVSHVPQWLASVLMSTQRRLAPTGHATRPMSHAGTSGATSAGTSGAAPSVAAPSGEVTSGEVTSGGVTSGEVTSGGVTSVEVTSGEVTSGEVTSGEVTSGVA